MPGITPPVEVREERVGVLDRFRFRLRRLDLLPAAASLQLLDALSLGGLLGPLLRQLLVAAPVPRAVRRELDDHVFQVGDDLRQGPDRVLGPQLGLERQVTGQLVGLVQVGLDLGEQGLGLGEQRGEVLPALLDEHAALLGAFREQVGRPHAPALLCVAHQVLLRGVVGIALGWCSAHRLGWGATGLPAVAAPVRAHSRGSVGADRGRP
ncbi:hypothetical protein [Streptomyces globosus]|uniref:hypothetical protein n=1 Tax=Streptomyces globosus TaxID=68209 RepID=UPI00363600F6